MIPVYINKIETAVPLFEGHAQFIELLPRLLPDEELKQKVKKVVDRLGIEKRYSVLEHSFNFDGNHPEAFYRFGQFPSTEARMQIYQQEALPLAVKALEPFLSDGIHQTVTHLIITSCTGFYAPGIDIDIIQKFGLKPDVERYLIGFMGCYAAITALKLARHLVCSQPKAKVLMVNVELCSLHLRDQVPLDQLISFLLFADGCAASLISAEPTGLEIRDFFTTVLKDSLDLMRWTISNDGFYMNLDSQIPDALKKIIQSQQSKILHDKSVEDYNLWAIHPGGRSILDAAQNELHLPDSAMVYSRDVLKNYGNMSSPTVMFVLKQILDEKQNKGLGCSMAFGPGLTLESFTFNKE